MFGIVANVESDRVLRNGAKVWILGVNGDAENAQVRGLSRGQRTVTKYIPLKRLKNFRAAWIPEHKRSEIWATWQWEDKNDAVDLADGWNKMWSGIQYFDRNGIQLRAGMPSSTAFKIAMGRHVEE